MHRQFRRYCFYLADRLKMSVKKLLKELDSHEIAEWMAYDLTNNKEWISKYNKQLELEASRQMSQEDKVAAFKRLFKGNPNNGEHSSKFSNRRNR